MSVHERVEQIYAAERQNIYAYLLHLGVSAPRAQEITQDAFVKLYLKMSRGESIDHPRAWLYRVAHNFALRSHQRDALFDELPPDATPAEPSPHPERTLIDRERRTALAGAIGNLSPQQRNCLHLRAQGLRYREIAEVVGISTSAVGEFLRRATIRLKEALNG